MVEHGLIGGFPDGSFRPGSNLTRAEGFALIARIINAGLLLPGDEEIDQIGNDNTYNYNDITNQTPYGDSDYGYDEDIDGETTRPARPPATPVSGSPGTPPGDDDTPSQGQPGTPQPTVPYIRVLTPFPEGEVSLSFIDITYTAAPTPGAVITEIFYTVNGNLMNYIYISSASSYTPRGEFGSARVFIIPQQDKDRKSVV